MRRPVNFQAPGSTDADFYRMAYAPLLVTAAGSFAVMAAAANVDARQVRTPSADNLNFPDKGATVLTVRSATPVAPMIADSLAEVQLGHLCPALVKGLLASSTVCHEGSRH